MIGEKRGFVRIGPIDAHCGIHELKQGGDVMDDFRDAAYFYNNRDDVPYSADEVAQIVETNHDAAYDFWLEGGLMSYADYAEMLDSETRRRESTLLKPR